MNFYHIMTVLTGIAYVAAAVALVPAVGWAIVKCITTAERIPAIITKEN